MKFLVTMKFIQPCPTQTGDFDNYEELHYVHHIPNSSGHNYHEEIICCLLVKNLNRQCQCGLCTQLTEYTAGPRLKFKPVVPVNLAKK